MVLTIILEILEVCEIPHCLADSMRPGKMRLTMRNLHLGSSISTLCDQTAASATVGSRRIMTGNVKLGHLETVT